MRLRHAITTLACCAALAGCGRLPQTGEPQPGASELRPIAFEAVEVDRAAGDCDDPEAACATVALHLLEATTGGTEAARDSANIFAQHLAVSSLRDRVAGERSASNNANQLIDAYLANAAEEIAASSTAASRRWLSFTERLLYNTTSVVTLEFALDEYSGGAHPNLHRRLVSFDVSSGAPLSLDELVGDRERLNRLAEDAFRSARGLGPGDDLAAAGFDFPDGVFAPTENFGVVADGLLLLWNSYEVAPYAVGPTEIVVPRAQLEGVVARDLWHD